ncbi:MAG: hypothetical protein M5U26_26800 [Planctomycetota bacterium]|nr:hypothetical protein [Planctomycetota bacterium]
MAATDATTTTAETGSTQDANKLDSYSGIVSFVVMGLGALLIVAVIVLLVMRQVEIRRLATAQASWDEVFQALKEKDTFKERIPALEGIWDKVKGSDAHPFVMLKLGNALFEDGLKFEKPPAERRESIEKAKKVFELVLKEYPNNSAYGPLAAQNAGLCAEQLQDFDGALAIYTKAATDFEDHFLYPQLCYQIARAHWLKARQSGGGVEDGAREEARKWVERALKDSTDPGFGNTWRQQAEYLGSLLENLGPALPDGRIPERRVKKTESEGTEGKTGEAKDEPKGEEKTGAAKTEEAKTEEAKTEAKTEPAKTEDAKTEAKTE